MDNIILYSQPGCGQCRAIHILANKKGLTYTEVQDIEEMRKVGVEHTPAMKINDELLYGPAIIKYINGVK